MAASEEKKRTRSPAYPSIDLKEAIHYAETAYSEEDHHAFTPEAAAEHWGYKSTSTRREPNNFGTEAVWLAH